ncbi:guanidinobutyrase [Rhipicephalus microplus]|uniref:guanidinobutyrase n=1 Tax=Rhipicephalus microplus TaxID=6941 RepID=UPI00188786F8|nr:guanidinobutyrase-like [Rhipicephalus microplus]
MVGAMQQPARCTLRALLLVRRLAGHGRDAARHASNLNQPLSGNDCPRPGGIATFMRLPYAASAHGLDVAVYGVPFDCGTSNRSGARFGPRQVRCESSLIRPHNMATRAAPYDSLQVADVGDVPVTMYDTKRAIGDIERFVKGLLSHGCVPVGIGGDHTTTYPVLRAIKEKHGPVGLLHLDAHADVNPTMMHCEVAHGTPFYRAVQEGLLDTRRVVQIGLRGSVYGPNEERWSLQHGFHIIQAQECWFKSMVPIMETKVLPVLGAGPVYISFDIDCLDPAFAPGTGTPEIGGLTSAQALEVIRSCKGLNIVGADLVEVSPPYDTSGNTALTAANLIFEMICVLPGVKNLD